MALAAIFGGAETDAFFVAFRIPNALRQILAEGAVSSAIVPVLTKTMAEDGGAAARQFFARIRGASILVLLLVTAAGVAAARPLTALFAHGYEASPVEFDRTAGMTAWSSRTSSSWGRPRSAWPRSTPSGGSPSQPSRPGS